MSMAKGAAFSAFSVVFKSLHSIPLYRIALWFDCVSLPTSPLFNCAWQPKRSQHLKNGTGTTNCGTVVQKENISLSHFFFFQTQKTLLQVASLTQIPLLWRSCSLYVTNSVQWINAHTQFSVLEQYTSLLMAFLMGELSVCLRESLNGWTWLVQHCVRALFSTRWCLPLSWQRWSSVLMLWSHVFCPSVFQDCVLVLNCWWKLVQW